jgi:hypothetical protein
MARWGWLLVLLAGCLPPRIDGAVDAAATTDAVEAPTDVTATGAGDDAGADAGADGATGTPDAPEVAAAKGCQSAADCADFKTPCAVGACDLKTGLCGLAPLPDGASCTNADTCHPGTCQAGACDSQLLACDDGNACTDDGCDPGTGCAHAPTAGLCEDGDPCTTGDKCLNGSCAAGSATPCDDGNPCTDDGCAKPEGCTAKPAPGKPCDDGMKCTTGDSCATGKCAGVVVACPDDGNPCTVEGCNKLTGACEGGPVALPGLALACDDGNPCTADDMCAGDKCEGQPAACDDKNPCTDDSCDPVKGCQHAANSAPCMGDACIVAAVCSGGACVGKVKSCDDGNACTSDACNAKTGCQSTPAVGASCGDGDACTEGDACVGGLCKGGAQFACDDGDPCSTDTCDATSGCVYAPMTAGSVCGPQKACTAGLCIAQGCGDGWCATGEQTDTCDKDCPASGGKCPASDKTCLGDCTLGQCASVNAACKTGSACATLKTCMAAAKDAQARLNCLWAAEPVDRQKWLALNACVQAFCADGDAWLGSKCAANADATCAQSCTAAMCPLADAACQANAPCAEAIGCVANQCDALPPADVPACVKACGGGTALFEARSSCQAQYCL